MVQESDQRGGDESNEDPGVNSDNEEDEEFKVICTLSEHF